MDQLRIAVATRGLDQSLRESIAAAGQCGASGVQFDVRSEVTADQFGDTASSQLLHLLGERGLSLASATFPLRRALYDPAEIDGRVHVVKEAMRLCGRLKCRVLTLRIGRIPEESQVDDRARLEGALGDLARLGARLGVVPAITTSGDSLADLSALVQSIQEGPVGIDLDPASCIMAQLDPSAMLRGLAEFVGHVQARDAVRDLEMGGKEVPLGRGETSWEELIATLADLRYSGWLTVRRTAGEHQLRDTANAVQYLRNVAGGW